MVALLVLYVVLGTKRVRRCVLLMKSQVVVGALGPHIISVLLSIMHPRTAVSILHKSILRILGLDGFIVGKMKKCAF